MLRIPNQDGIFVKVAKNDNVARLADKYGSYKQAVYVANLMSDETQLKIGSEIFLPGAKFAAVTASAVGTAPDLPGRLLPHRPESSGGGHGQDIQCIGWRRSPLGQEGFPLRAGYQGTKR